MEYTAEQYLERIENKRLNSTPLYSRKEMIDFAEKYAKQLTIHSVMRPKILDSYESGCIENKKQIQPKLIEEQFYCFDEEDDLKKCNEQCMSCRSIEDARKPQ